MKALGISDAVVSEESNNNRLWANFAISEFITLGTSAATGAMTPIKTTPYREELIVDDSNLYIWKREIPVVVTSEGGNAVDSKDEKLLEEKLKRIEQKSDLKIEEIRNMINTMSETTKHYENLMDGHMKQISTNISDLKSNVISRVETIQRWCFGIVISVVVSFIAIITAYSNIPR